MKIKGVQYKLSSILALLLYYGFAQYLPNSHGHRLFRGGRLRRWCCGFIFKKMGSNVKIERKAQFGSGRDLEIGDNSGLGVNCCVPYDIKIGSNVMMGPNCYIFSNNHVFDRLDIPMIMQGKTEKKTTIIEDDVWIGRNVTMTPGRYIKKGSIVGACCVLTKDFPEFSVIGGNPSRLLYKRQ